MEDGRAAASLTKVPRKLLIFDAAAHWRLLRAFDERLHDTLLATGRTVTFGAGAPDLARCRQPPTPIRIVSLIRDKRPHRRTAPDAQKFARVAFR
jgi:hypothetical protein